MLVVVVKGGRMGQGFIGFPLRRGNVLRSVRGGSIGCVLVVVVALCVGGGGVGGGWKEGGWKVVGGNVLPSVCGGWGGCVLVVVVAE